MLKHGDVSSTRYWRNLSLVSCGKTLTSNWMERGIFPFKTSLIAGKSFGGTVLPQAQKLKSHRCWEWAEEEPFPHTFVTLPTSLMILFASLLSRALWFCFPLLHDTLFSLSFLWLSLVILFASPACDFPLWLCFPRCWPSVLCSALSTHPQRMIIHTAEWQFYVMSESQWLL